MISTTAAIERKKGLDAALAANPDIKLLDFQVANWKSTEAFDLTQQPAHPLRRRHQGHLGGQ